MAFRHTWGLHTVFCYFYDDDARFIFLQPLSFNLSVRDASPDKATVCVRKGRARRA